MPATSAFGAPASTLAYPASPWRKTFSGGTTISSGLAAARAALARAGIRRGRVVLLSDLLDSPGDAGRLERQLTAYADDPDVTLDVRRLSSVGEPPPPVYGRVLGRGAVRSAGTGSPPPLARRDRPLPLALIGVALLAALALGANELVNVPLRWRQAEAAG